MNGPWTLERAIALGIVVLIVIYALKQLGIV